jgi:hypothetical protein
MQRLGNFLAMTLGVGVFLVTVSLVTQQPTSAVDKKAARAFYLTTTMHTGGEVLTACAAGFHMASLWEIFDPSNLRYDTTLGMTTADSGSGPPVAFGWIRTGFTAFTGHGAGADNCNAWESSDNTLRGSVVILDPNWDEQSFVPPRISPWRANNPVCAFSAQVWCVED